MSLSENQTLFAMKKLITLTLLIMFFITVSCEKSNPDPLEDQTLEPDTDLNDDEDKPPALYDDIVLNEMNIIIDGSEFHIHSFDVTYQNSKLYFNVHTKKNFDASLHFILVNFAVDSFPFGIGSSNIFNLRYPDLDEYGLVDKWATGFNGGLPSGYFVIDFIDTLDLIVYGYFEFMNLDEPTYPGYRKIQKSYFKVNYEMGTNSLVNNSADIFMNSGKLNVIDIPLKNYFPRIHSRIVFDDNSAMHLYFFHEELELGNNPLESGGFNASWNTNVDFPVFYYGGSGFVYHADSGYVDIKNFDIDNQIIEGDLNIYYKSDNFTGSFVINY